MTVRDWGALTPQQRLAIIAQHLEAKIKDCGSMENYLQHAVDRITPRPEPL
jgi:hypothetical protein